MIVADNASNDDSLSFLKNNFPFVEIIELEKNYGFAGGYNKAFKKVEADYYILLNSDVEVTKGWIEPVIEMMEADGQIAACQPKILSHQQKKMFEHAGAAGGWIDYLGYTFARGRVFDVCEEDNGQYDDAAEIFWATGAALFIRAKIFHEMQGFDTFFFAHMEEIDLCWRMKLRDYKIMYCGKSFVYHVGGGTLPKGNYRKVFLNFRNNLIMLFKNLSLSEKIWKLPLRILLDILFAVKSLLGKDIDTFKAVFAAHFDVFKWHINHKKNKNITAKKMRGLTGVTAKSLVWEYFIKKKKHFSEIVDKNFR